MCLSAASLALGQLFLSFDNFFSSNTNTLIIFSFGRILKHQQLTDVTQQITAHTVPVAELGSWQMHCTYEFLTPKKIFSCYFFYLFCY